jgi:glycosyltransferase involved in cell wall biosynthesis
VDPLISVIIPARNEELNIGRCLNSLVVQQGVDCEIFVVDDHSTDRTSQIAAAFDGVRVIPANPLADGWTGKANAIATAVPLARGEWLLFTDADTVHAPGSLANSIAEAQEYGVSMLSYSPGQETGGFWERAVQPVIFAELSRAFVYDEINRADSAMAAANGQYILMRRSAYDAIGGHAAVRGSLLEDVELARAVKRVATLRFRYAPEAVSTRMYRDTRSLVEGWTKNLAALFPHALPLAIRRVLESVILIGGPVALIWTPWAALSSLVYAGFTRRLRRGGWPLSQVPRSILGLPFFAWLLLRSYWMYSIRKRVTWKGRSYATGTTRAESPRDRCP